MNLTLASALDFIVDMSKAGLEYQYIGQQYRAKIAVKITPTSKLVFHINYKKINEFLPEKELRYTEAIVGNPGTNIVSGFFS